MEPLDYTHAPAMWRRMLKIHCISAREVALQLGINLSHFYNVLNGKSSPTLEYAQKIETKICEMINLQRVAKTGDSNETGRDSQQRTDEPLSSAGVPSPEL
jgi:transcriptional regulator with XRE-family HTH domain